MMANLPIDEFEIVSNAYDIDSTVSSNQTSDIGFLAHDLNRELTPETL